jgi:phospholipase C
MKMFKGIIVSSAAAAIAVAIGVHLLTEQPHTAVAQDASIHKIKHVIIIMQENRSFDTYFGTYPGANGIPASACVPAPQGGCVRPYHDPNDRNAGGPHGQKNAIADIVGGHMDGFIMSAQRGRRGCRALNNPNCANGSRVDVVGYHDQREIPNYWT